MENQAASTEPTAGWLQRLVKAWRCRRRAKDEERLRKTLARMEDIELRREVMIVMGNKAYDMGSGIVMECLMDIMGDEQIEHTKLVKLRERLQRRLNDKAHL